MIANGVADGTSLVEVVRSPRADVTEALDDVRFFEERFFEDMVEPEFDVKEDAEAGGAVASLATAE